MSYVLEILSFKCFENYAEMPNGKWISWAWNSGGMKYTFVSLQCVGGPHSHGLDQKWVLIKREAFPQMWLFKE